MGAVNPWGVAVLGTIILLGSGLVLNTFRNLRQYANDTEAARVPSLAGLRPIWAESDLPSAYLQTEAVIDKLAAHADPYVKFVGRVSKLRIQAALEQENASVFQDRTVRSHFAEALQDLSESVELRSKTAVYQSLLNVCMAIGFGGKYSPVLLSDRAPLTEVDWRLIGDLRFCAERLDKGDYLNAYNRIIEWSDSSLMMRLYPGFLLPLSLLRDRIVVGATPPDDMRVSAERRAAGFKELAALVDQVVSCLEAHNYSRLVDLLVRDQERMLKPR